MNASNTIGKLAEAMSKAQSEMKSAPKDRINPHFKNRYSDLTTIWDTIRGTLAKYGIAVIQRIESNTDGVCVSTMVIHSGSGEWISDSCYLPVVKKDPQGYGSAITYARRYSLSAMLGVVSDDDDDGEVASTPAPVIKQQPQQESSQVDKMLLDEWLEKVAGCKTKDELDKLVPEIQKLNDFLKSRIRNAFVQRTAEIMSGK